MKEVPRIKAYIRVIETIRNNTIPLKAESVTSTIPCFAIRLDEEKTP